MRLNVRNKFISDMALTITVAISNGPELHVAIARYINQAEGISSLTLYTCASCFCKSFWYNHRLDL